MMMRQSVIVSDVVNHSFVRLVFPLPIMDDMARETGHL